MQYTSEEALWLGCRVSYGGGALGMGSPPQEFKKFNYNTNQLCMILGAVTMPVIWHASVWWSARSIDCTEMDFPSSVITHFLSLTTPP